jgi:hypothetical protein
MLHLRSAAQLAGFPGLRLLTYALLVLVGLGADPLYAQPFRLKTAPPAALSGDASRSFEARIAEQARVLADEPRFKHLPAPKRQGLVEFILGNMLFVAMHQMGHALLSETNLPALSGREQAADDFAVLTVLKLGETDFSDRVLIEAAKGWFVSGRQPRSKTPDYYAGHGFNGRRGSRIVCLMIGADPARFTVLADETRLPNDRRRTCGWDYDTATRSWDKALAPYRRAADQPRARVDLVYGVAEGALGVYAQVFRNLRFLEIIAEHAAGQFAWSAPIGIDMRSCGEASARWIVPERKLVLCYEQARDLAEVYSGH